MSRKMKAMVSNLVDSSLEGSIKSNAELESNGSSILNEEIFDAVQKLISDYQFRKKHLDFIYKCLPDYNERNTAN